MTIIETLNSLNNVEDAINFLKDSKLKKPELIKLAKENNIFIMGKWSKEIVIEKIVAGTTGAKIKINILTNVR